MDDNHEIIWHNCLNIIKGRVGQQSFNTWFAPIKPLSFRNKVLTIQVPSQFFYEWLEEHYVYLLREAIDHEIGKEGRLEYSVIVDRGNKKNSPLSMNLPTAQSKNGNQYRVNPNQAAKPVEPSSPQGFQQGQSNSQAATGTDAGKKNNKVAANSYDENYKSPFAFHNYNIDRQEAYLNIQYTFDSYIEGDCNRLARSAGYAVSSKPGATSFNPLMIYGGVGLGKTHLVHAIGNEIKRNLPNAFILYVSSEKFTNQFIEALKTNNIQKFSNFYLQVDVLILDDVQFLSGKEKTQEIFFHVFNHLHQSGKQIIMTSDNPPSDLKGLEERLLSRFKWGLTADVQPPDFETRMAIIERKAQSEGINIPKEVVEYIAYNVDTNIRELEGVLISLVAHTSLDRREMDLELARQILKNIVYDSEQELSIDFIQKTVSEYYNIPVSNIKSKTRRKEVVLARQVAMYFSKVYTKHSLKAIGYHFGGRDHSTVIHGVQNIIDNSDNNSNIHKDLDALSEKLKIKKKVTS